MDIDENVVKITTGTSVSCHIGSNPINNSIKDEKNDKLVIIDNNSSESSSSDESDDVQVVNQYKLDDVRPVIGNYGKYYVFYSVL